ncbi:MAG: hypothetical protein AB1700_08185 [Bacillota bacterium]
MTLTPGMKGIVEDINRSHKERGERLKEIRSEARTVLDTSRKLMLTVSACRKKASAELKTKLSADIAGLQDDTARLIRGYAGVRHAAGVRDVAARLSEVQRIRQEVSSELGKTNELVLNLGKYRKESSAMLAANLIRERQRIALETAGLLGEAEALIRGFTTRRKSTSKTLWDNLRKHNKAAQVETHKMLDGFRESREKVQSDLRAAAELWKGSQRGQQEKTPASEMHVVGSSVEEVSAATKVESASGEDMDLETRVLTVVRENPTGLSLAEIADEIGVHSVALGRPIKNLLERSAVRKEGKVYVPVSTGAGEM